MCTSFCFTTDWFLQFIELGLFVFNSSRTMFHTTVSDDMFPGKVHDLNTPLNPLWIVGTQAHREWSIWIWDFKKHLRSHKAKRLCIFRDALGMNCNWPAFISKSLVRKSWATGKTVKKFKHVDCCSTPVPPDQNLTSCGVNRAPLLNNLKCWVVWVNSFVKPLPSDHHQIEWY